MAQFLPIEVSFGNGVLQKETISSFKASLESFNGECNPTVTLSVDGYNYSNGTNHMNGFDVSKPDCKSTSNARPRKKYLVMKNRNSGEIKMIEYKKNIFQMNSSDSQIKNQLLQRSSKESCSNQNKKRHLVSKFGQKKGQRFYEQNDKLKIEEEAILKKAIKVAKSQRNIHSSVVKTENNDFNYFIPPCNRETLDVREVYVLNDILSFSELSKIEKLMSEFDDTEATELYNYVCNFKTNSLDSQRSCASYYLHCIVQMVNQSTKKRQKVLPILEKKNFISVKLTNEFTVNGYATLESIDKAVCYVMVLALLLCNYRIDYKLLTNSLLLPKEKLAKLVLLTGASIKRNPETGTKEVILKLPLESFDINKVVKMKK